MKSDWRRIITLGFNTRKRRGVRLVVTALVTLSMLSVAAGAMMFINPPNDPGFLPYQWYLHLDMSYYEGTGASADSDIDALEAWGIETGESEVWVAILDSGIPTTLNLYPTQRVVDHPDLEDQNVHLYHDWAVFYDDWNGSTWQGLNDTYGHGTAVTGIIAAEWKNALGMAGLAPENIHIVPVKIAKNLYAVVSWEQRANAIETTVQELTAPDRKLILSCSWSGWNENVDEGGIMWRAIEYARDYNALVVCSIGNNQNEPVAYPAAFSANFDNVIAVGASTWNRTVSDESATGPEITVIAPGGGSNSVETRLGTGLSDIYTTTLNRTWSWWTGTSFATPQVSGLAALVWSMNPDLNPAVVRDKIIAGAVLLDGVPTNRQGHGIINAYNTLQEVSPPEPDPPTPPTAPGGFQGWYNPDEFAFELRWYRNPPDQEVDKYWLERALEEGEFEMVERAIPDPGSGLVLYYDTYIPPPSVEYLRYRVRAHNSVGWGPFCNPKIVWNDSGMGPDDAAIDLIVLPRELTLHQNYPNPFNPSTQIRFGLPEPSRVRLQIMNARGETVRILVNEEKAPGWYTVTWDGKNESGQDVGTGIYLYILESDSTRILKKMTLIR